MEQKVVLTITVYHLAIMRTTGRKVKSWFMMLFFNILDITGIASYNNYMSQQYSRLEDLAWHMASTFLLDSNWICHGNTSNGIASSDSYKLSTNRSCDKELWCRNSIPTAMVNFDVELRFSVRAVDGSASE
jgi:hypothetical protein